MSIDKLISELDKDDRDYKVIKQASEINIKDYLGVVDAYVDLLSNFLTDPEKVDLISNIIVEIVNSIKGLNNIVKIASEKDFNPDDIDSLAGLVLRGEQNIDQLIEEFEKKADFSR